MLFNKFFLKIYDYHAFSDFKKYLDTKNNTFE